MSWEVMLIKTSRSESLEALYDTSCYETVGFTIVLEHSFETQVGDGNRCKIEGKGFTISYQTLSKPSNNLRLYLEGEQAIYPLIDLCIKEGWYIFDVTMGNFIQFDKPERNGYHISSFKDGKPINPQEQSWLTKTLYKISRWFS